MPPGSLRALRPLPDPDQPISLLWARELVRQRDGAQCHYCGIPAPSGVLEHQVPRRRGGQTTLNNCVWACAPCNTRKHNSTASEYRQLPERGPATRRVFVTLPAEVVRHITAAGDGDFRLGVLRLVGYPEP